VTVSNDPDATGRPQATWTSLGIKIPLEVVDSPYREFGKTVVAYVRSLRPAPEHTVTVVVPELVVEHWWEAMLHNQDASRLKGSLLRVPWVVVMSIPLHVGAARRKGRSEQEDSERPGASPTPPSTFPRAPGEISGNPPDKQ
jgi:hypothetical protein